MRVKALNFHAKERIAVSRKGEGADGRRKRASREPWAKRGLYVAIPLLVLGLVIVGGCGTKPRQQPDTVTPEEIAAEIIPKEGDSTSYGIPVALNNTQRFINYYDTITLTPEQESTRRSALLPLKAPCCDDNSMYDC
jgi:hypothetical protein